MKTLRATCPAKVNLGLRVVGRRADGYHEIVTIFQAIELCDVLTGELADELALRVSDDSIPNDERNLVLAAALLVRERVARARGQGARLSLDKAIPAGAGLGGGSSDAAGTLLILNELWTLGLSPSELQGLAAELGSDVPFFLVGGTALGTGRGSTISALPPIRERIVLLGSPPFRLATADVYRALTLPLTPWEPDVTVPRLFVKLAEGNDFSRATNDLEAAAFGMRGELAVFRDALSSAGAEVALVSGSGSTVFGLFRAETEMTPVVDVLRGGFPDWTVRISKTVASGARVGPAVR